jgi:signal transduction histidine kinase
MNQRLLLRVTAPVVAVGLLLFGTCLASIRYIDRLQSDLAEIVAETVTSLHASQDLEIRVRQLRFHTLLYLMDPTTARLEPIEKDHRSFETALEVARNSSRTPEERDCVRSIAEGYEQYRKEQDQLRIGVLQGKPVSDFPKLADSHPIRRVVDPCKEFLTLNQARMQKTADECQRVSQQGHLAMWILGLAGPVGGVLLGFGVTRALRHSIYRLSVRVQDVAQRLDQNVASVSVVADGDIRSLDRQMDYIVEKIEDVAERLQQHQRELMRADQLSTMGQLAAGIAHEVRNPLTGIKMLVEAALRSRNARPLTTEDVGMMHRELARLEQTVQGFLDFARPPTAERTLCDLREVIQQACDLVRVRTRQQNVQMVFNDPGQPVMASVDRNQMGTVMVNLLINALDAMPSGGRLEIDLASNADGSIRVTVSDTGNGIAADVAGRLFRPFVTTKPQGTGLGLSISGRILEEHGGSITADNRPEGGARFVITLPVPSLEVHGADLAADRR